MSNKQPINIKTLGSDTKTLGCVPLTITIGGITRKIKAHIMQDLAFNMLIGLDEAALFELDISTRNKVVTQQGELIPLVNMASHNTILEESQDGSSESATCEQESTSRSKQGIDQILGRYNKQLKERDSKSLYTVPGIQHSLLTTTDVPVASCPHRLSMDKREKMNIIIQELLDEGKIQRTDSPYASPAFLVGKKDGNLRMVIDYRRLNEITLVEPHPIPRMDDLLDGINDPKVFSVIDLKGAYHHIRMSPADIRKTAFITSDGHYEWLVMPFGLKNAPATFARYMTELMRKYQLKNTHHYFDDILIATRDLTSHLRALKDLFMALAKENLTVNTDKCHFLQDKVDFLGMTINSEGIRSQDNKVEAIKEMPDPKNRRELMRFLGMVNFYHKFIPNYALYAAPLHDLLKKDTKWSWDENCRLAVGKLKDLLSESHILIPFNRARKTILYTDASGIGIGAVLKQEIEGMEKPVAFFSKRFSPPQTRYTTSEQEALAIVKAIEHWNYYLDGHKFIIKTDHKPLTWLKSITNKNRRLFNWSIKLSTYDYTVEYLPGETNVEADVLSRAPVANMVTLQEVRNALERSEDPIPANAYEEDSIIYIDVDNKRKLYVPESLRTTVVAEAHKQFGHLGVKATSNIIQLRYYWPQISKDISHFINNCDTCERCKNYAGTKKGELRQLPPASQPMEFLSMDTVSGFRDYGSVKTNMTIVVDHATRYAWTFASRNIKDDQAINCIRQIVSAQGPIKALLTDRYPAYFSRRFDRFLVHHKIEHKFTTPYHPQANGICERINNTITNKLRCLKEDQPRQSWVKLLKIATIQYNNTIHSATGFPPSYLLLGRTTDGYMNEHHDFPAVDQARLEAARRIQEQHERNKAYYDKKKKPVDINIGDLVFTKTPQQVNIRKLDNPYEGPWKVLTKISSTVFEIDKPDRQNGTMSTNYHCSMLKKYKGNPTQRTLSYPT